MSLIILVMSLILFGAGNRFFVKQMTLGSINSYHDGFIHLVAHYLACSNLALGSFQS
jgi:hypothetical protein